MLRWRVVPSIRAHRCQDSSTRGVSAAKKVTKASVKAAFKIGEKILSKARQLERDENEDINHTWVANMAPEYQGCYQDQKAMRKSAPPPSAWSGSTSALPRPAPRIWRLALPWRGSRPFAGA